MIKRITSRKAWVVVLTISAVFLLVLLSAGLDELRFQPGSPLGQLKSPNFQAVLGNIVQEVVDVPVWKQVFFGMAVFLFFFTFIFVLPAKLRKRVLKNFLRFMLFILVILLILRNFHFFFPNLLLGVFPPSPEEPTNISNTPSVFLPPAISPIHLYLLSIVVILALISTGYWLFRRTLSRDRNQSAVQSISQIADIARMSLVDVSKNPIWEDAIIRCYGQMVESVENSKGLHRRKDITASEFVVRLEEVGLPIESVRRLTHLFEDVRYGNKKVSDEERANAIDCLSRIIHDCEVSQ